MGFFEMKKFVLRVGDCGLMNGDGVWLWVVIEDFEFDGDVG